MIKTTLIAAAFIASTATFAAAEGDPEKGEKVFKRCQTCHMVGDNARRKIGPVLNDLFGRQAGTTEGYRYSKLNKAAGEAGLVWTPETVTAYLPNPSKFLKDYLKDAGKADQAKGRTKMSFRLRNEGQVADVVAFLKQHSKDYTEE